MTTVIQEMGTYYDMEKRPEKTNTVRTDYCTGKRQKDKTYTVQTNYQLSRHFNMVLKQM